MIVDRETNQEIGKADRAVMVRESLLPQRGYSTDRSSGWYNLTTMIPRESSIYPIVQLIYSYAIVKIKCMYNEEL